jgi:eukaryotic-like serine/threonine-protein kinase
LMAVPFDEERLEKRGAPVPVLDDVGFEIGTFESRFDISRTGTLIYRKAGAVDEAINMIQWVDDAGNRDSLLHKVGMYRDSRLSPDGKRLVAQVREDGVYGVQVYDLQRETWTQLAVGGRLYIDSVWSGDGQFIVLGSLTGLYWTRADGATEPQPLMTVQAIQVPWSITADGKHLAYVQGTGNAAQIWTVALETAGGQLQAGKPEPFLRSPFKDGGAAFSPDGKWLAYDSNSSGTNEVYVRAFPDNGERWKTSNSGGQHPVWSRTGHDLLYQSGDQMMAVGYSEVGGTFVPDKPRVWTPRIGGTATDLSPDGKRLLVVVPVDRPNVTKVEHEVVLFQNFVENLRQHVPLN